MENKITPTAEELIKNIVQFESSIEVIPIYSLNKIMIEFAKLHVEAALEARDRLYQTYFEEEIKWTEDNLKFIKGSYSLENIK